jgi:hypothetical protein
MVFWINLIKEYQTFATIEHFRHLTDTRSAKAHSKYMDKCVVQFTQTSDQ